MVVVLWLMDNMSEEERSSWLCKRNDGAERKEWELKVRKRKRKICKGRAQAAA